VPIATVQTHLKQALAGFPLPLTLGRLSAFIQPPNPNDDGLEPCAYVWGSHGDESRETMPRAKPGDLSTGGDKKILHQVNVWLVWFGEVDDPNADVAFPAVIDAVCGLLRNTGLVDGTQYVRDPVTGQLSQLLAIGEHLSWEYGTVRAVADQRYLRYDAQITCEVEEIIQA
jgi:hypothetical protein